MVKIDKNQQKEFITQKQKWDKFREKRAKFIDKYLKIKKSKINVKNLITLQNLYKFINNLNLGIEKTKEKRL